VFNLDTTESLPVILKSQVLIGPLSSKNIVGLYLFALLLNIITSLDCRPAEIGRTVNLLMFYSFLSTKLNVMPSPLSMKYQANHISNPLLLDLTPLPKSLSSSSIIRVIIIKVIF
jgi:hypothetical protein